MKIVLVAAILSAIAGSSFAQVRPVKPTDPTTIAIAPPTIVDATGKAVGTFQTPMFAMFRYGQAVIAVPLAKVVEGGQKHSARVIYAPSMPYFYASADCSGIPFATDSQTLRYGDSVFSIGARPAAYTLSGSQMTAHIAASGLASAKSFGSVGFILGNAGVLTQECSVQAGTTNGYSTESSVILPPGPLTVQ